MNPEEDRAFLAMMAYKKRFGDENAPDMDTLPHEFRDMSKASDLLERCVREGRPVYELVEVREYDLSLIY